MSFSFILLVPWQTLTDGSDAKQVIKINMLNNPNPALKCGEMGQV